MGTLSKTGMILLAIFLLFIPLVACGGNEGSLTSPPTAEPAQKVKITIGVLTDITGMAAVALEPVDKGLEDIVRYYNDNNLIPGIEVEVIKYDGQFNPDRDVVGWQWLKERGADVIVGWLPTVGLTLQPLAEKDKLPLFLTNAPSELIDVPGYTFLTGPRLEDQAWNLIRWVMENHWDWETKGPAKVGGVGDEGGHMDAVYAQFKKYAQMYPARMEWVAGCIVPNGTYRWDSEVETLKDCDYIYPPNAMMPMLIKDYVAAGHNKATFIGTDACMATFEMLDDMGLWPKIDGMIFICQSEWWSQDAEYPNLAKQLLNKYREGSAEEIMNSGKAYFCIVNGMMILESVKAAADRVGPENVDARSIYEGTQSMSLSFDGLQRFSFSDTKRVAPDRLAIFEADGSNKDIQKVSDWFLVETAP